MILQQDPRNGYWTVFGDSNLTNVHHPWKCKGRGCAVHDHPSDHPLKDAPLNWRIDRGILERICPHGVGHPDRDSAKFLDKRGLGHENIHGCDGCC